MCENDYLPDSCPVCGYFGTIGEFLKRGDKYHLRLVCPQCGARIDFVEFRGKCIPEFPHPVAKWVYGSFVSDKLILSPYKERNENRHFWYMVDPETVGQFTGLLDCNGKEIYEGDIVKFTKPAYTDVPVVITWEDGAFMVDHDLYLGGRDLSRVTVIGNVHDNPNLLEASHD